MLAVDYKHEASQETAISASDLRRCRPRIVVVGSGPVGMRLVDELLSIDPLAQILMFGNEPARPYNRVQLSALLAGQVSREQIDLQMPDPEQSPHFDFQVATIESIDREQRVVRESLGGEHSYDILVLATGARAHMPSIEGIEKSGVYCFRNIADTEALFARVTRSRHVVVLGGGLLGIEAASALLRDGTRVTLIQQGAHLMNRQLDAHAAHLLSMQLEEKGIEVIVQSGVREVFGDDKVTGVRLYSGDVLDCDTVVVCAGISPNMELARAARLQVGRAIAVNDHLCTSDPNIFAIGECCEHQGQTFGLVNPGYEQAAVLARHLSDQSAAYHGSSTITQLKVVGQSVVSMGEVVELEKHPRQSEISYHDQDKQLYRKLVLRKGKLVGALSYGDWPEAARVSDLFKTGQTVWPWQRWRFSQSGSLWPSAQAAAVENWPAETIICQCKQVTRGEISAAVSAGACSVEAIQKRCGASSVCGSCKPLVAQLADQNAPMPSELAWRPVMIASLLALVLVALYLITPAQQVADSVQTSNWFEQIWNDKFWKQVSGFTLLGLTAIGLIMSLRKHFKFEWMGRFGYWRLVHVVLGLLCAVVLMLHTGFHSGNNLNQILLFDFVLLLLVGSSAGLIVALSHHMKASTAGRLRKTWTWSHILLSWPLPALLIAHIVSVYYF